MNKNVIDQNKIEIKKYKKKFRYFNLKNGLVKNDFGENIITDINYISLFIIKFLIIIHFYNQINSYNIFFKYSKISLKIKGPGKNVILGNKGIFSFKGINYLKEVFINGYKLIL